jgi:hypothetical protein
MGEQKPVEQQVNWHEVRVVGLSRSGNHCIINWLLAQVRGRYCFLNCAEGKTNPFRTARPLESGRCFLANYGDFDLAREQAGAFSRKDYLVHSYEDSFLAHACSDEFEAEHDALVGSSARRADVLVLRDPFNLFASRRRMGIDKPDAVAVRIWKQHAREFLRPRRMARRGLFLNYNRWCADRDYRQRIAERLGLTFTDSGRDRIARCGGGSSFDGFRFDGHASGMAVVDRWRHAVDDASYRAISDAETVDLAERIFGMAPEPFRRRVPVAA